MCQSINTISVVNKISIMAFILDNSYWLCDILFVDFQMSSIICVRIAICVVLQENHAYCQKKICCFIVDSECTTISQNKTFYIIKIFQPELDLQNF